MSAKPKVPGALEEEVREQDRYLPVANINRIMKKSLPPPKRRWLPAPRLPRPASTLPGWGDSLSNSSWICRLDRMAWRSEIRRHTHHGTNLAY